MDRRFAIAAAALVGLTSAQSASALVLETGIRSISTEIRDRSGAIINSDSDSETVTNDDPYTRNLRAFMGSSNAYEVSVGMSVLGGVFGIDASTIAGGTLSTDILVLESYTNDSSRPVQLKTSFIVLDGSLWLVAGEGSTLTYDLDVGTFPFGEFNAQGTLTGSASFNATFTESGDSLGATQGSPGSRVQVPFQRHELDLGIIAPGDSIDYFYSLSIFSDAPTLEIAQWDFVDPGNLGPLSLVTATPVGPVPSAVPLPPSLGFLALALLPLARGRRRTG
jgi:hypothetical protein